MPSPPKPWEVSGAAGGAGPVPTATTTSAAPASAAQSGQTTASTAGPPPVPTRPDSASVASAGNGYGASPYGSQMASQYGTQYGAGYGSTLSPYASRYGAGSTYGGYGSTYGSTYGGGYGAGGYGGVGGYSRYGGTGYGTMPYNRFGGGPPYGPGGPGDMPLSAQLEQSTQATFNTLDSIVQAFAGFAQMLESTFMATHSSFMAMVGVAEQFGNLKSYLGQLFSVMSLYRLAKRIYCKLTGRAPPVDVASLNADSFKDFQEGKDGKKRSKKPLWVFLLFTIGIPYAISKLFQRLQKQRLEAAANAPEGALPLVGPDGNRLGPQEIRNLDFGRVLYDFNAENPGELSLPKGEIVAILSKIDPATGQPGLWWRGRLQAGQMGMFPANYVE
ncbi:Peroxin 13, N-terminal region-domain-containing protein, partial [Fimicolochytrium jonesii]|uniref:Peroxin 13, N-terminal region-domain-containing protein n=1 Tax=Fimicolochytrium jonesii TaxID=1396493 RepID=UPI0022FEB15C